MFYHGVRSPSASILCVGGAYQNCDNSSANPFLGSAPASQFIFGTQLADPESCAFNALGFAQGYLVNDTLQRRSPGLPLGPNDASTTAVFG